MNGTNLFKIALRALANNKLRAFLTMLGIIIGVASVITMLAIASYLAKGYSMKESIRHAKEYITHAIIAGKDLNIGHGNGPLWHFPDSIAGFYFLSFSLHIYNRCDPENIRGRTFDRLPDVRL